jgi:DNA-binding Xre family transcriptional regulator
MIVSRVKEVMESKGITLARLVEDTGLAEMTVIRARDHRIGRCHLDTLAVMARYLGVKTRDLYSED